MASSFDHYILLNAGQDMHYAEFAADESTALREAIKEYEANKWKVIGQKVGKPAKACEQYAKEHFGNANT
ncbi:SANT [Aspergillus sp. HF37]|nr:SANT [Aspergillus sp. HF37]